MTMWIPVSERMPESGRPVLIAMKNVLGKGRVLRASYAAPKTLPLHEDADVDGGEYDEVTDKYYCREGWYEENEFEEIHWSVEGDVTHWMPLPRSPYTLGDEGGQS